MKGRALTRCAPPYEADRAELLLLVSAATSSFLVFFVFLVFLVVLVSLILLVFAHRLLLCLS